jgi:hypothetical protein
VVVAGEAASAREPFDVIATRVQRNAFWVTARASSAMDGGRLPARHTIAASLRLLGPTVALRAALSANCSVAVDNGIVDGRDTGTSADLACRDDTAADIAGIVTPDTTRVCGASCDGSAPPGVFGTPPLATGAGLTSDSAPSGGVAPRATIRLTPGIYAPRPSIAEGDCDRTDAVNWGDPAGSSLCADYFPSIHVSGDVTLSPGAKGQGFLIADGSVRLEAGARFVGVVIAGNDIAVVGPGAVIDGIAIAKDFDLAGTTRVADGGAITFNRCAVHRAELGVARLVRTRERWWAELR